MKKKFRITFLSLVLPCFLAVVPACRKDAKGPVLELSEQHRVQFLDSLQASWVILQDEVNHFFDSISVVDMSIQMQRNYEPGTSREVILEDYRHFLRSEVLDFSTEEQRFLRNLFQEAFQLVGELSASIFPEEIQLIKTNGRQYGQSAFYTREHCIIIPANELETRDKTGLLKVMLHEIFHIYARYRPVRRNRLYALIGFEKLPAVPALPGNLATTLLLNPDGTSRDYAIRLLDKDQQGFLAIPLLQARPPYFDPGQPQYFNYLHFQLYRLSADSNKHYQVLAKPDGSSTIDYRRHPEFFEQIGDNTDYIIHPDEILADNFVALVLSVTGSSETGGRLLKEIEKVLK